MSQKSASDIPSIPRIYGDIPAAASGFLHVSSGKQPNTLKIPRGIGSSFFFATPYQVSFGTGPKDMLRRCGSQYRSLHLFCIRAQNPVEICL